MGLWYLEVKDLRAVTQFRMCLWNCTAWGHLCLSEVWSGQPIMAGMIQEGRTCWVEKTQIQVREAVASGSFGSEFWRAERYSEEEFQGKSWCFPESCPLDSKLGLFSWSLIGSLPAPWAFQNAMRTFLSVWATHDQVYSLKSWRVFLVVCSLLMISK